MPSFQVRFNRGRGFFAERLFASSLKESLHVHRLSHHALDDFAEGLALPPHGLEPVIGLQVDADRLGHYGVPI